jgi:hypothetical protein
MPMPSPASSLLPFPGPLQGPVIPLSQGSDHAAASPHQIPDTAPGPAAFLVINQSNAPLPWTHRRATSMRSSGAPTSLPRLRMPSFRSRFPSLSTLETPGIGTSPHRVAESHSPSDNLVPRTRRDPAPRPTSIELSTVSPSRSVNSLVTPISPQSRLSESSLHGSASNLGTQSQSQSPGLVNLLPSSSPAQRNARLSSGVIPVGSLASQPRISIPQPIGVPFPSGPSTPATNGPGTQPSLDRHIRPMHADQVSRYVKKGDVYVTSTMPDEDFRHNICTGHEKTAYINYCHCRLIYHSNSVVSWILTS